jgi:PhnB protein
MKGTSMSWKPKEFAQCLPCVVAKNGKESIKFYRTAFGFKELENTSVDEHGDVQHAMLQLGEVTIMLTPEGAFGMPHLTPISSGVMSPVGLYIYVEDIDKFYDQAVAAGAKSLNKPEDSFWGDRYARLMDLDGYEWSFATYTGKIVHQHVHTGDCC